MTNYNIIADGAYICEHRRILKDLGIWKKMTDDEKAYFAPCYRCSIYNAYAKAKDTIPCPCDNCPHCKTEVQVDNRMISLRRKYF